MVDKNTQLFQRPLLWKHRRIFVGRTNKKAKQYCLCFSKHRGTRAQTKALSLAPNFLI